jgi:hypothetical protein
MLSIKRKLLMEKDSLSAIALKLLKSCRIIQKFKFKMKVFAFLLLATMASMVICEPIQKNRNNMGDIRDTKIRANVDFKGEIDLVMGLIKIAIEGGSLNLDTYPPPYNQKTSGSAPAVAPPISKEQINTFIQSLKNKTKL